MGSMHGKRWPCDVSNMNSKISGKSRVSYFTVAYRFLVRNHNLAKIVGASHRSINELINEFLINDFFEWQFNPLKNADQWKAALLYAICRIAVPDVVIETGVASGHSSLGILSGMHMNKKGHLHSIDLPGATYRRDDGQHWTDVSSTDGPGWLVPTYLKREWTLHIGSSQSILPDLLESMDSIDVFYHDSEHTYKNMLFEMEIVWPKLKSGGFILADNVNWEGKVLFPYVGVIRKQG